MSLIDWSDSEGMFGLLLDFIADERAECREDPERYRFLSELLTQLTAVKDQLPNLPTPSLIQQLRDVHESVGREFADDPVMAHVRDCIEEIERVEDGAV